MGRVAQSGRIYTVCRLGSGALMGQGLGEVVRSARLALGLTQHQVARAMCCSTSTVSRWESGATPLRDVDTLQRLARVLQVAPAVLGVAATVTGQPRAVEDDPVRRRQLLAHLAATAASVAVAAPSPTRAADADGAGLGEVVAGRVRDALLGLGPEPTRSPDLTRLRMGLVAATRDFDACRYSRLSTLLPGLIRAGHAATRELEDAPEVSAALGGVYTLATRLLIKFDDQQLGWMAADRARVLAGASGDPLAIGEAARNLAVLARKAGWHEQAQAIALAAADDPGLRGDDPRLAAQRGLLVMSAAYTAARNGDRAQMRALTDRAQLLAQNLRGAIMLPTHGGGFGLPVVGLHRISAEHWAGDPAAAIAAADMLRVASLPTIERQVRCRTDVARAFGMWGRRQECLEALLAAEHIAPQEVRGRPAVRSLVSGLLTSGRVGPELRGLAARCGLL